MEQVNKSRLRINFCWFIAAPAPSNVVVVLGTNCLNKKGLAGSKEWFIPRGGNER